MTAIDTIREILNFDKPPHHSWRKPSDEDINTAIGFIAIGERAGIARFNAFSDHEGDYEICFYIRGLQLSILHDFSSDKFEVSDDIDYLEDQTMIQVLGAIKEFGCKV